MRIFILIQNNFFHIRFSNSFSNFGDNSVSGDKQPRDRDRERERDRDGETGETEARNLNDSNEQRETNESESKPEERPFPRIQIKSPSKLAQEFSEKQKQSDVQTSNESNRTNNNKSSVDLNTTPLYDEPTENRSYSMKEAHSFETQNHEPTISSTDTNTMVVVAEATENSEH